MTARNAATLLLLFVSAFRGFGNHSGGPGNDPTYVYAFGNGSVAVIDGETHELIETVPTAFSLNSLWAKRHFDGEVIWSNEKGTSTVVGVDLKTLGIIASVEAEPVGQPSDRPDDRGFDYLELSPGGERLYIVHSATDEIIEIDIDAMEVSNRIMVGPGDGTVWPCDNTITSDSYLVTPNKYGGNVYVVDVDPDRPTYGSIIAASALTKHAFFGTGERGAFMNTAAPNGRYVFVENYDNTESVIDSDPQSPTFGQEIAIIPDVGGVCSEVTPDSRFVFVRTWEGGVKVIDVGSLRVIQDIDVGGIGCEFTISQDGYVYVPVAQRDVVVVIDASTLELVREIDTEGTLPEFVVVSGVRPDALGGG